MSDQVAELLERAKRLARTDPAVLLAVLVEAVADAAAGRDISTLQPTLLAAAPEQPRSVIEAVRAGDPAALASAAGHNYADLCISLLGALEALRDPDSLPHPGTDDRNTA